MSKVLGIVGYGTVGRAVAAAFEGLHELLLHDPALGHGSVPLSEIAAADVVFVCVPTPMGAEGDADLRALHEVLEVLLPAATGVVCIKSTVPPDAIARLVRRWPDGRLVVSPEFLRDASPIEDMLAMRALVVGGAPEDCQTLVDLFRHHSHVTGPMRTSEGLDAIGASFLKYQANTFLAAKVSLMNEFARLFAKTGSGSSWDEIRQGFALDHERHGTSHDQVPGPDGQNGWGGRCFPKDVAALRAFAAREAEPSPLLDAIVECNDADRRKLP